MTCEASLWLPCVSSVSDIGSFPTLALASRRKRRASRVSMGLLANQSGQGLVEFALAVVPLVFLLLGIFTLAFAFLNASMVTYAVREAARAAAVVPPSARQANGQITLAEAELIQSKCLATWPTISTSTSSSSCEPYYPPVDASGNDVDWNGNPLGVKLVYVDASTSPIYLPFYGNLQLSRSIAFVDEGR